VKTARPDTAVHRAAWLSPRVVLFVCSRVEAPSDSPVRRHKRNGRLFALPGPRGEPALVGAFVGSEAELEGLRGGVVVVRDGSKAVRVAVEELLSSVSDLRTVLREDLAGRTADVRTKLLDFLATLPLDFESSPALSAGLHTAREALRERRPLSIEGGRGTEPGLGIDAVCPIGARRFFVRGWIRDPIRLPRRVSAVSPEGERVELSPVVARHPDDDVVHFACLFHTQAPSTGTGWAFTLEDESGEAVEAPERAPSEHHDEALRAIVATARWDVEDRQTLLAGHVEPALTDLQSALRTRLAGAAVERFGTSPEGPELSLVLSLDRAGDLLEHHLAQTADDSQLWRSELVCVFDGPCDPEAALWRVQQLHELYGRAMTAVVLSERCGAALMREAGVARASASRLLFLEAGVLPTRSGWLAPLMDFYSATPMAGAVTAKLVRSDGAIAMPERFAGLHASIPAANITAPVSGTSGACMLIDTARYREAGVGGWRYAWGGRADEELCFRLTNAGYDCWYVPRVALVRHGVDAATQDDLLLADAYNSWLLRRAE
jgi:hypothetical protein